ncbi:MAG TPA: type II secretion system protein GspJ [Polyangiaceae bacterium]
MSRRSRRSLQRGLTLVEVLVALAVLAMIGVLLYGTFDSLNHQRKAEALRGDRARQGRQALVRMTREIQTAFLSMHNPANVALQTRVVAFIGQNSQPYDRLDFQGFSHRRIVANSHESDQAEIGYFASADPDVEGKMDLVRREQTPADMDPKKGGVVDVLCEDIDSFDIHYFDPQTSQWVETWDTTQALGQQNRLPMEVKISLVLKHVPVGVDATYMTKFMIPMQQPLSFGIPQ